MKGLFKSKPKTPVVIVRCPPLGRYIHLFPSPWTIQTRRIAGGIKQLLTRFEASVQLTKEFFVDDTLSRLLTSLPNLNLEIYTNERIQDSLFEINNNKFVFFLYVKPMKDATQLVANLQRQQDKSRLIASDYLESNIDLMAFLMEGFENTDMASHYGTMFRECICHHIVAKYV